MALIPRAIKNEIAEKIQQKTSKAIILYGPRQAGKTTLVKEIIGELSLRALCINADEYRYHEVLSSRDATQLTALVSGYELLFIDEAQRVANIGVSLKILIDTHPKLKIIVTGSSTLELAQGVSEPLTGRKWTYTLFPISQLELTQLHNTFELDQQLEERLIWGSYPEIFSLKDRQERRSYLAELSGDYLYKDVLKLSGIKNPDKLQPLLKLLAFQIGQQVSMNELGTALGMGKDTVAKYISLLEKSFVLLRLGGFSRNLRKEVSKNSKYYFYDLGIRNAIISDFRSPADRNDLGHLWENFLIIERFKRNAYRQHHPNPYFWRTYTGAEIDYLEDFEGRLQGYEIKFSKRKARAPQTFLNEYENSTWQLVSRDNVFDFICDGSR